MVPVLAVKAQEQAEAKVRVEAKWVGRLQQDRAEIVCVQAAEQLLGMLLDNLAMQRVVQNVEQE